MRAKYFILNEDFYSEKEKYIEYLLTHLSNVKRNNLDESAMFSTARKGDLIILSISGTGNIGLLGLSIEAKNHDKKLSFSVKVFIEKGAIILTSSLIIFMSILLFSKGISIFSVIMAQFLLLLVFFFICWLNLITFRSEVITYIKSWQKKP